MPFTQSLSFLHHWLVEFMYYPHAAKDRQTDRHKNRQMCRQADTDRTTETGRQTDKQAGSKKTLIPRQTRAKTNTLSSNAQTYEEIGWWNLKHFTEISECNRRICSEAEISAVVCHSNIASLATTHSNKTHYILVAYDLEIWPCQPPA